MRILHITPIGKLKEGIGSVLCKLAPSQEKCGHQVKVISVFKNEVYHDLKIEQVANVDDFILTVSNFKPNVVVFHSVYYMPYVKFGRVLKSLGIPYLVQMHGALSNENYAKSHFKKWLANTLFFNNFLCGANAIIYLNKTERNNCIINKKNPQSIIIPNGCDNIPFSNLLKPIEKTIDILYIGRIDMIHKGNDKLIEAVLILKNDNYKNCKLSVYANPNDPDLQIFKEKIAGLEEYIEYKGGIYGPAKEDRLKKADIFILTSRYEGMPMGILEALSYGIPCIVTPGTNMSDDIKDAKAGWVAPFDSEEIAKTIKKAVDEYYIHSNQFRMNAHNLAAKYDWQKIAKDSIISYQSVINQRQY